MSKIFKSQKDKEQEQSPLLSRLTTPSTVEVSPSATPTSPEPAPLSQRVEQVSTTPSPPPATTDKRQEISKTLAETKPEDTEDLVKSLFTRESEIQAKLGVPQEYYKDYVSKIDAAHQAWKDERDRLKKAEIYNTLMTAVANIFMARYAAAAGGKPLQPEDMDKYFRRSSEDLQAVLTTEDKKLGQRQQQAAEQRTLYNQLQENIKYIDSQQQRALDRAEDKTWREKQADIQRRDIRERQQLRLDAQRERDEERKARQAEKDALRAEEKAKRDRDAEAKRLEQGFKGLKEIDKVLLNQKLSDSEKQRSVLNLVQTSNIPVTTEQLKSLEQRTYLGLGAADPDKLQALVEDIAGNTVSPIVQAVRDGRAVEVILKDSQGNEKARVPFQEFRKLPWSERRKLEEQEKLNLSYEFR